MKVLHKKAGIYLIVLCCVTYSIAYFGRLSYAANITAFQKEYLFPADKLGLISSFLFFSYGGGQIAHAFFSKYYNHKWMVALGMLITAVCNFLLTVVQEIGWLQLIWMVNGISQSVFWCNICNVQAKYLSQKQIRQCVMWGGFSYCFGSCGIYALSALFVEINWRLTFYIVTVLSLLVGIWWFLSISKLEKVDKTEEAEPKNATLTQIQSGFYTKRICLLVGFVAAIAIINAFIRDGFISWMPTILKDSFGMDDSLAVFVTMGVSLLSVLGIFLATFLSKKIQGRLFIQSICFVGMGIFTLLGALAFQKTIALLFVLLFGANICLIYCNGNVITGQIPFAIKKYGNVGCLSSLLDAFCYLGSTLATYIFGALSLHSGWNSVIILIAILAFVAAAVGLLGSRVAKKDEIGKTIF